MWIQRHEIMDDKIILPDVCKNDRCCILKRFLRLICFYNKIIMIKAVTKKQPVFQYATKGKWNDIFQEIRKTRR
jgi:hypothetical protein